METPCVNHTGKLKQSVKSTSVPSVLLAFFPAHVRRQNRERGVTDYVATHGHPSSLTDTFSPQQHLLSKVL